MTSKWDVFIHMPAAFSFPIGSRCMTGRGDRPEPHMGGRRVYHARQGAGWVIVDRNG